MDERTGFLILSRAGESDDIPITGLLDITVLRGSQKDPNLTELLEGKFGRRIQLRTGHRTLTQNL
jgi:hypothetical protein